MANRGRAHTKIDRRLIGESMMVGERTLQPVARVVGWYGVGADKTRVGAGAWLRVIPIEVIVRERDGHEYRVPLGNPMRRARRGIVLSALLVAVVCWLLILVLRWKQA
jgi:hypothetical protein